MAKQLQKSEADIRKVLNLAEHLRTKVIIPSLQLENFLNFQYSEIAKRSVLNFCTLEKTFIDKAFKRAFKTLNRTQQVDYYLKCVKIILKEVYSTNMKNEQNKELQSENKTQDFQGSDKFEQITVLIKKEGSFKKWIICKIQLASQINVLRIFQSGEQLDLHHYILRESHSKNRLSLVLESTDQFARPTTFRISNYNQSFEELKNKIQTYLINGLREKLSNLLKKGRTSITTSFRSSIQQEIYIPKKQVKAKSFHFQMIQKQSVPATLQFFQGKDPKSMKKIIRDCSKLNISSHQCKKIYTKLINHQKIFGLSSLKNFDKVSQGIFHNKKSHVTRRVFCFDENEMNYEWLVTSMNCYKIFKRWKSCLFLINLLAEFPDERTKIYHQINLYKDYNEVDYIFLRHLFEIDGINYFIDKSVNTQEYSRIINGSRGWIEECVWRFRKFDGIIQVLVQIQFGGHYNKKNALQMAIQYIGELGQLKKEYQQNQKLNTSTLKTVYNQNLFLFQDQSQFNATNSDLTSPLKNKRISRFNSKTQLTKKQSQNQSQNLKKHKEQTFKPQSAKFPSFLDKQNLEFKQQYNEQNDKTQFLETQFFSIDSSSESESDLWLGKDNSNSDEQQEKNQIKLPIIPIDHSHSFSTHIQTTRKQNIDLFKYSQNLRYLLSYHNVECLPKDPQNESKKSSQQQGHFLWRKQWKITQKGELININEEQIKVQSSVLKLVAKRMGRNILAGKSVLNISLPIQIFGTDSNLQRLCKSMAYAPRFLEKASKIQSPLQRMKQVMCFALGYSLCYIEMQKPFNPILGETYQGVIDGCPVYGEQISHHPPISTVLFKGRGFTVYGNLEAKVDMGLNSASGINDGIIKISFDPNNFNQNIVKFTCPPGQISGLVMGDRKLSLIKKTYYYDQKNNIFAYIQWGSQKKKNQISFNNDYFQGQIVQLKPNTDVSKFDKIKQSSYQKIFSQVKGRWTGQVFFDDIVLFDVRNDGFYNVVDYKYPLQSNVHYREDIILRKKNDLIMAQEAKQKLQQIQRDDRKLRKKYEKQN